MDFKQRTLVPDRWIVDRWSIFSLRAAPSWATFALSAAFSISTACRGDTASSIGDAGADGGGLATDLDAAVALCPSVGRKVRSGDPCLLPEGTVCRVGCLAVLAQCKGGSWALASDVFDPERCPARIPAENEPCGTCGPSACAYGCEVGRTSRIGTQAVCTALGTGAVWKVTESACKAPDAGAKQDATAPDGGPSDAGEAGDAGDAATAQDATSD